MGFYSGMGFLDVCMYVVYLVLNNPFFVLNVNYPVDDKYVNLFTMYKVYKLCLNQAMAL